MAQAIGIGATGKIAIGLVEDNRVVSSVSYDGGAPDAGTRSEGVHGEVDTLGMSLLTLPMEEIVDALAGMVRTLCSDHNADPVAVGICFPGIIRDGVIEESPNLKQAKGANLGGMLSRSLASLGMPLRVSVCNDADAIATGIAAQRGQLSAQAEGSVVRGKFESGAQAEGSVVRGKFESGAQAEGSVVRGKFERLIRVWTLGQGVGFGRYPHAPGPCEGGHTVVSIDPKESYCGCGGKGHLEGIMGHRAMRLRFLDLEPEEVFANARQGDPRCADFELLWHRALAAASATSIHLDGPGKFFITGGNSGFVKVSMLTRYLQEMVTMSPLQGSVFEVIPANEELAIIGAAVNAAQS